MQYIPTEPTLQYVLNEHDQFVTRDIWYERGNFFLEGTEHELMTTPMGPDAPFDKIVIRLSQELRQIALYIPNVELSISFVEAYMTLPHTLLEDVNGQIEDEVLDRVCSRLEPIELDIISVNKLSPHPIMGHGDSLNLLEIVERTLMLVRRRLYSLRTQGYYFGCVNPDKLDILLVRPY